jgi:hypothetical protein
MNRLMLRALAAALGLTFVTATQVLANGHPGDGSGHQSGHMERQGNVNGHRGEFNHSFKVNGRFDFARRGYKSFYWNRYCWSDRYHCYCYWAPNYGWCFYQPTYACYVPLTSYQEVYPESRPALTAAPAVVQETTVALNTPIGFATPPVAAAPAVVQQTKVVAGPGGGPVDLPPVGPGALPGPGALQQTRVAAGVP